MSAVPRHLLQVDVPGSGEIEPLLYVSPVFVRRYDDRFRRPAQSLGGVGQEHPGRCGCSNQARGGKRSAASLQKRSTARHDGSVLPEMPGDASVPGPGQFLRTRTAGFVFMLDYALKRALMDPFFRAAGATSSAPSSTTMD